MGERIPLWLIDILASILVIVLIGNVTLGNLEFLSLYDFWMMKDMWR